MLAPLVTRRLPAEFTRTEAADRHEAWRAVVGLTTREQDVLTGLGEGLPNAEIAARLFPEEMRIKDSAPSTRSGATIPPFLNPGHTNSPSVSPSLWEPVGLGCNGTAILGDRGVDLEGTGQRLTTSCPRTAGGHRVLELDLEALAERFGWGDGRMDEL